jgi:putative hemolysin
MGESENFFFQLLLGFGLRAEPNTQSFPTVDLALGLRATGWNFATYSKNCVQRVGAVQRVQRKSCSRMGRCDALKGLSLSKDPVQQDRMVTYPVGFLQQDGAM